MRLLHDIILKRAYNLRIMELDYPCPFHTPAVFHQPLPPFIENQKFRIRLSKEIILQSKADKKRSNVSTRGVGGEIEAKVEADSVFESRRLRDDGTSVSINVFLLVDAKGGEKRARIYEERVR